MQAAPFEVCFQREGTADVAFLISPAGGVQRPIVSEKDSTLSRCLAAALARVTFPRSDDAAVTEVTVTVHVRRRP